MTKLDLNALVREIESINNYGLEEYNTKKQRWTNLIHQLEIQFRELCALDTDYKIYGVYPDNYPIKEEFKKRDKVHLPVIDYDGNLMMAEYEYSEARSGVNTWGEKYDMPARMYHSTQYGPWKLTDSMYMDYVRKYVNSEFIDILLRAILEEAKKKKKYRLDKIAAIKESVKNLTELELVE